MIDLLRYVSKDTYQTVLEDKSGYDHILTGDSRMIFGIQRGSGALLIIRSRLGGSSPHTSVYHTTGLLASNFFRAMGIPFLLYIDDRHNEELQVALDKGKYASLNTVDERHQAAVRSAIFLVAKHLVLLGYYLCLVKPVLMLMLEFVIT